MFVCNTRTHYWQDHSDYGKTIDPVKVPKRTNAGAQSIYVQIYTTGLLDTAQNYIRNLHLSVEGNSYIRTYYDTGPF